MKVTPEQALSAVIALGTHPLPEEVAAMLNDHAHAVLQEALTRAWKAAGRCDLTYASASQAVGAVVAELRRMAEEVEGG